MKRVGVIGGGQLAWMMAGAAKKLGVELVVQTPSPNDPAVSLAAETIFAPVDDAAATAQLATRCDVITFENEFVNLEALAPLAEQGICFRPGLQALAPLLDKYDQRCYLQQLGLPVPKFVALTGSREQGAGSREAQENAPLPNAILLMSGNPPTQMAPPHSPLPFPVVLKARRHGYDGQGTFILKDSDALKHKLEASYTKHPGDQPLFLLEEFVSFERELAVIAARSPSGEIVTYPIVETQQEEQVCRRVLVPADMTCALTAEIEAIAHTLMDSLQAVGVFGIELFLTPDGKVLVNEIAPRTHNSGHFTIEACETSQFEAHLRAVCGLPLGNPALRCAQAVMVNLLGYEYANDDYLAKRQQMASLPQAHVHWYGKTESRPGRKLGHVTTVLDDQDRAKADTVVKMIESIWYATQT